MYCTYVMMFLRTCVYMNDCVCVTRCKFLHALITIQDSVVCDRVWVINDWMYMNIYVCFCIHLPDSIYIYTFIYLHTVYLSVIIYV